MTSLKEHAKSLRSNMTEAEQCLWHHLRGQRFHGFKFRRQHIINHYIVDFVCLKKKLIVEVDGGQHSDRFLHDQQRTHFLSSEGYRVLRFWNPEIFENLDGVLETILLGLREAPLEPVYDPII
jgi:very-short-patch-repair endonuclease